MPSTSIYLKEALCGHVLLGVAYPSPTSIVLALHTSPTSDFDDDGTEVVGGSYMRQPITFTTYEQGVATNDEVIEFVNMPGVTVTHMKLRDDNDVMLLHGPLDDPAIVAATATLTFAIGDLEVRFD